MRQILEPDKKNIFAKIYVMLSSKGYSSTYGYYLIDIFPFATPPKKDWNTVYRKAYRYSMDSWDKDTGMRTESFKNARKKIELIAQPLLNDERLLSEVYQNNCLVTMLKNHASLCSDICHVYNKWEQKQSNMKLDQRNLSPERFLLSLICHIYDIAQEAKTPDEPQHKDALSDLLQKNNCSFDHAFEYLEFSLTKDGTSTTNGVMEILFRAGYPDNINSECDPFTLLKASDYYYNKTTVSENAELSAKYKTYSYRYSDVAFKYYGSPQAAWNLGHFWYAHNVLFPNNDPSFSSDEKKFNQKHIEKALEYFMFSAEHGYYEAINSIGNISKKLMDNDADYPTLMRALLSFARKKDLFGTCQLTTARELTELFYKTAAEHKVIPGMSNYYKFLVKKIISTIEYTLTNGKKHRRTSAIELDRIKREHENDIREIQKYLTLLCEYRHPDALTDAATLMLHKNLLNECLHNNKVTQGHISLSESDDYEFIFPYYVKHSDVHIFLKNTDEKLDPWKLLKYATDSELPSPISVWPYYYLAELNYDNMRFVEASKYISLAKTIIAKDRSKSISKEYRAKIKELDRKCADEIKKMDTRRAKYLTDNTDAINDTSEKFLYNCIPSSNPLVLSSIDKIFIYEHGLSCFWMQRLNVIDSTIMTPEEIKAFNDKLRENFRNSWKSGYYNLNNMPFYFIKDWLDGKLKQLDESDYYLNGSQLTKQKKDEYVQNMNINELPRAEHSLPLYAIINKNTAALRLPTNDVLISSEIQADENIIQETTFKLNDPVIIFHESADKQFVLAVHKDYIGWIKNDDCSFFDSKDSWLEYQQRPFLVVTHDNGIKEVECDLLMGTKLFLSNKEPKKGTYVIELPARKKNGGITVSDRIISDKNYISKGYVPFTTATLLEQAFHELGSQYGWGGINGKRDCSSFVHDIYSCFGLELPRNSKVMSRMPKVIPSSTRDEDRESDMKKLRVGDILIMNRHLAIYLGELTGTHYVISMLQSYIPEGTKENLEESIIVTNRAMISTMNLRRLTGKTWLQDVQAIVSFDRMK